MEKIIEELKEQLLYIENDAEEQEYAEELKEAISVLEEKTKEEEDGEEDEFARK